MPAPVLSGQFRRDVKRLEKRGKDMTKLRGLLGLLIAGTTLPARYRDHPLKGDWKGYRDAHVEPDWLVIYRIVEDQVQLARTGTHSDLFDE